MTGRERQASELEEWAREIDPLYPVDLGIVRAVKLLRDAGLHTIESCEGGEGHAFAEPTVRFYGTPACGWKAISVLMAHGLPIFRFGQMWTMDDGHPTGPEWFVTFLRRLS